MEPLPKSRSVTTGGRSPCATPPGRSRSAAGRAPPPPRPPPVRGLRFEDTNRYVRGRVVRALVKGEELPADMEVDRLERALSGLERDGLIVRTSACVGLA